VRNLAQRSAHAAKGTAELIEESIARSDRGVVRVEKVSLSIQEVTGTVNKLKVLIDQVSEASRQQAHGFGEVSQALTEMEQMTQTNASAAEASSAAGAALNTQAQASLVTVAQLESLVGIGAAASKKPAPGAPAAAAATKKPLAWRSTAA
jgi:methyl-accepting chemotaxis protein